MGGYATVATAENSIYFCAEWVIMHAWPYSHLWCLHNRLYYISKPKKHEIEDDYYAICRISKSIHLKVVVVDSCRSRADVGISTALSPKHTPPTHTIRLDALPTPVYQLLFPEIVMYL